jgi:DNA-binding NarL/FixJ family response regulator
MKPAIRILLVDNHPALRQALANRLNHESGLEVVGLAPDGPTAVKLAIELRPDVVVMDLAMPGMHGADATRLIREQCPQVRVIGFSIYANEEAGTAMAEAGAFCSVSKRDEPQALILAIRAAGPGRDSPSNIGG